MIVRVLGTTTTVDGTLAVEGLAHNGSADAVVIRDFTLRTTVAGHEVSAPGTDHDLVVPGYSTVLWQATLPFAGNTTPITYMAGGRQFILIQTDNARDRKAPQGAAYAAFALPQ